MSLKSMFTARDMTQGEPWKRISEFAVPMLLALFVGISTGAGIMIVGPLLTMPMLKLLNTPESIIYWCADYSNIYFYGIVGFFMYNMLSGVLRGLGDSLSALATVIA